jgi:hypothetical protein
MITSMHTSIGLVPTKINGLSETATWEHACSHQPPYRAKKPKNASARGILASGSKAYDGRTANSGCWMQKPFAIWLY